VAQPSLMAACYVTCMEAHVERPRSKLHSKDLDNDVRNVTHATRSPWVGRNSGPIVRRLWVCGPKFEKLSMQLCIACTVCNADFRSTIFCFVPEIFAIKSLRYQNSRPYFDVIVPPNFFGGGPNF